jgi:hypothetical protein
VHEPFALLVSVYDGDRPDYVRRALRSAVADQTVRPDQVIIVRDGPVAADLAGCLDEIMASCVSPVTFVPLEQNSGLGPALDRGLAASWYDVIARMDADDIAMPHRFEVQLPLIAEADIVGSGLLEFVEDTDQIVGQRVPPVDAAHIARYARVHDPFNHPTVVYRRDAVLAAGGYGDHPLMEDYALFARMIQSGARTVNVAEPLVFYRVGASVFKRRGGTVLLRSPGSPRRPSMLGTSWSVAAIGSFRGGSAAPSTARSWDCCRSRPTAAPRRRMGPCRRTGSSPMTGGTRTCSRPGCETSQPRLRRRLPRLRRRLPRLRRRLRR